MSTFAADLDVGMPPRARFAIDIMRRDDTYYRTIHLWANSPALGNGLPESSADRLSTIPRMLART